MITFTKEVLDCLSKLTLDEGMAWLVSIRWDRGEVDNFRGANGETVWERTPSRGWQVHLYGDYLRKLLEGSHLERHGPLVFVQQPLLDSTSFPGGIIDVADGELVFTANAD